MTHTIARGLTRALVLGSVALGAWSAPAGAWPAALQTGARVRVSGPWGPGSSVTGTFVRHDDSTLTLRPDRERHATVIRFAEISRLEADVAPTRASNRAGTTLAIVGGVTTGLLVGAYAASVSDHRTTPVVAGVLGAIPGIFLGAIAGSLIGGGAAAATTESAWVGLPRDPWANGIPGPRAAPADSAGR